MLPKSERLRKNSEFTGAYNLKKSVANSLFVLYVGRKKELLEIPTRVGFVVGKKIHKKATKRNRIKRLMREAYKNIRKEQDSPVSKWRTLIFIARQDSLGANYKQVYDAMKDCLRKALKRESYKFNNPNR